MKRTRPRSLRCFSQPIEGDLITTTNVSIRHTCTWVKVSVHSRCALDQGFQQLTQRRSLILKPGFIGLFHRLEQSVLTFCRGVGAASTSARQIIQQHLVFGGNLLRCPDVAFFALLGSGGGVSGRGGGGNGGRE